MISSKNKFPKVGKVAKLYFIVKFLQKNKNHINNSNSDLPYHSYQVWMVQFVDLTICNPKDWWDRTSYLSRISDLLLRLTGPVMLLHVTYFEFVFNFTCAKLSISRHGSNHCNNGCKNRKNKHFWIQSQL